MNGIAEFISSLPRVLQRGATRVAPWAAVVLAVYFGLQSATAGWARFASTGEYLALLIGFAPVVLGLLLVVGMQFDYDDD